MIPKEVEKYIYYEEPGIILLHGDCLEILPDLEGIDLVVTSPPYDDLRDYEGYSFNFNGIADGLASSISDGGIIVWVVGDATIDGSETGSSFRQVLYFKDNCGLNLHDTMIYEKNGTAFPAKSDGNRYSQIFEYMFILSKSGRPKTANLICDKKNKYEGSLPWDKDGGSVREKNGSLTKRTGFKPVPKFSPRNNIWKYNTGAGFTTKDKFAFEHPAMFPELLAEDHIKSWSKQGDIVLDPFMGSGTVAKIAKKLGRKCIGIELEQKYLDIAVERLKQEVLF